MSRAGAAVRPLLWLSLPWVPIGLGAAVMRAHAVPVSTWGQNLIAAAVGTVICAAAMWRGRWGLRTQHIALAGSAVLVAATLAFAGVAGVHRWVSFGSMQVNTALLSLPLAIAALYALLRSEHTRYALVASFVLQGLLVAQPDASQATGLAAAFFIAAVGSNLSRLTRAIAALGHILLAMAAWRRPDTLAPVAHVEGIMGLAGSGGLGWGAAAVAALILIPLPFVLALKDRAGRRRSASPAIALAVYWSAVILATLRGEFPIPLMGYGVSPILGYYLALGATGAARRA